MLYIRYAAMIVMHLMWDKRAGC